MLRHIRRKNVWKHLGVGAHGTTRTCRRSRDALSEHRVSLQASQQDPSVHARFVQASRMGERTIAASGHGEKMTSEDRVRYAREAREVFLLVPIPLKSMPRRLNGTVRSWPQQRRRAPLRAAGQKGGRNCIESQSNEFMFQINIYPAELEADSVLTTGGWW